MIKETVVDTDYATMWYYPEAGIIHHVMHKYTYGDQLRYILEEGLAVFRQYGIQKWLSDDRKNSALPQADIDWSEENWVVPMIAAGWKYWAVVLPDRNVGKAPMLRVVESFSRHGLQVEIFDSPEAALEWLESI